MGGCAAHCEGRIGYHATRQRGSGPWPDRRLGHQCLVVGALPGRLRGSGQDSVRFTAIPCGYGHDNMRKRALQVIAKIPKADSDAFSGLVERACHAIGMTALPSDFAELLLEDMNGGFACRDFPDAMIRLAESQFCLS